MRSTRPDSASRSSSVPGTTRRTPSRPGSPSGWATTAAPRSRRRCARSGGSPGIASAMSWRMTWRLQRGREWRRRAVHVRGLLREAWRPGLPRFCDAIARCGADSRVVIHRPRQQSARLRSRRRGLRRGVSPRLHARRQHHARRHRQHEELHHPGVPRLSRGDPGRAPPFSRCWIRDHLSADAHAHLDRPGDPVQPGGRSGWRMAVIDPVGTSSATVAATAPSRQSRSTSAETRLWSPGTIAASPASS